MPKDSWEKDNEAAEDAAEFDLDDDILNILEMESNADLDDLDLAALSVEDYEGDDEDDDDGEEYTPLTSEDLARVADAGQRTEMNKKRIDEVISQTVQITPEAAPKQATPPPAGPNRRQHNRIQASILVNYISTDEDGDGAQGMGVVLDISISGLQLQTPRPMVGTHIKLFATDFNDTMMQIDGIIRQSRQKGAVYLNGISFESSENTTIKFITNLVRMFNARRFGKAA